MKFSSILAASAVVVVSIAGAVSGTSPASAAAASTVPAAAQSGTAKLRIAHFSPDAPAIDVYFDGNKRLTNVLYEKHSNYLELPSGAHKIEIRATGSAADVPAVVSADADLAANGAYTLAAIGKLAAITGKLYTDDTSAPPAGKVKLRVMHDAPDLAAVDVVVKNGQELAAKLAFPDASPYLTLDPGKYDVEVRPTGSTTASLASTVVLQAGGVYTVAAIGGADKAPKLKGLIDLPPAGGSAVTTADAGAVTTLAAASTSAADVAPSTAGQAAVTEPTETAPATEPAPEATTADTTKPADTTTPAVETTLAPDTTVAVAPTSVVPKGPIGAGAGGLSGGGGAVGATALAGLAAVAIMSAARKRRAA